MIAVNFGFDIDGASGSGRPVHRIGVLATGDHTINSLTGRGFELRNTAQFGATTSTQQHNGTALTIQNHNFTTTNRSMWVIFRHTKIAGGDRLLDTWLSQANDGDGRIQVHTQQVDKHYANVTNNMNLNVAVGNNSKTLDNRIYLKQVIAATMHQ